MKYENYTPMELLRELSLAFGPSGCEGNVREIIREYVTPYADEITEDKLGSLVATYKRRVEPKSYSIDDEPLAPDGKPDVTRLMLQAHMDEVGFMIRSVDKNGYLKITPLSGRDPRTLAARNVTIGDEERKVPGYFGLKPAHLGGTGEFKDMYVDIGAKDKDDALTKVKVGDFGTYRSDFVLFGENDCKIKGKALDDRLGCAILCLVLRHLAETKAALPFDVCFAFTCREEIGGTSAQTAANFICPDMAICLESTAVNDLSGDKYGYVGRQGQGGCLSFMDRSTIYDKELFEFIMSVGKEKNIPVQAKQYVSGGNDARVINRSMAGVRVAALSAPSRYIHTASNVVDARDYTAMTELLEAVIAALA